MFRYAILENFVVFRLTEWDYLVHNRLMSITKGIYPYIAWNLNLFKHFVLNTWEFGKAVTNITGYIYYTSGTDIFIFCRSHMSQWYFVAIHKANTFAGLKTDLAIIDNVNNDFALYGRLKGFRLMTHWHWQALCGMAFRGNEEIIVNVILKLTEKKM